MSGFELRLAEVRHFDDGAPVLPSAYKPVAVPNLDSKGDLSPVD